MDLMSTAQILGNFGEFVGAIAVVVTLIYLALEVRHSRQALDANTKSLDDNRRLARAQSYQVRAQMTQNYLMWSAESKHIAPIANKISHEGWNALTLEEQWRYEIAQRAIMVSVDNSHYQYSLGYLDQEYWDVTMSQAAPFVRGWKQMGILQGRKQFIDDLLSTLSTDHKPETAEN